MAKTKYKEKEDSDKRLKPVARDGSCVMMLFITLVAIATGCVMLYLDNEEYGGKPPPKEVAPTITKLGEERKADPAGVPGPGPAPGPGPGPAPMPMMP